MKLHGIDITERTVRYHLRILDERGYTEVFGKEGRKITGKGKAGVKTCLYQRRLAVISKIETLSYQTTLDLKTLDGDVILNISYFPEEKPKAAIEVFDSCFSSPNSMSDRIILPVGRKDWRCINS